VVFAHGHPTVFAAHPSPERREARKRLLNCSLL
jgi:hypothetical protein